MAIGIGRANHENEVWKAKQMLVHVYTSQQMALRLSRHLLSHWQGQQ
jgi:hypothetical protein